MKTNIQFLLYRASLMLVIIAMLLSACKPAPAPATTEPPATQPPATKPAQPTETIKATNMDKPTITPKPTVTLPPPTPTIVDPGLPAEDDGSPLPPQIIEQQPQGGQELSVDGEIILTFNQPMDAAKTAAALNVTDDGGKAVEGKITWSTPRTLHFKPSKTLKASSQYHASLSTQAISSRGVTLAEELSIDYTTVGDLQISQVFPLDGATGVASNAVITVIFNRPVVPLIIVEERDKLPAPLTITPEISGKGEWVSTSVYAFHADKPLKGSTTYAVTIQAGLADAANESQLAQDYTWQFSTIAPSIASFEYSGGYVNPNDFTRDVLLDAYFTINFYQPMDQASTEAALSLGPKAGGRTPVEIVWNKEFTQMVITPTQRLALGSDYALRLDAKALSVDGGALSAGLNWNFKTVLHPAVEYTIPKDGSKQKGFSGELRIKFVSPMNIASVKDKIVILPKPTKEIEWWYNEWEWSIVSYALEPSTKYEVRLLPGMQDIYGNTIQEGKTIRFETGVYPPYASLNMPYEPALFRASQPHEFYAQYRNIKSVQFKLYRLSVEKFAALVSGQEYGNNYHPDESDLVVSIDEKSTAAQDKEVLKKFTLATASGKSLEPGFYFLTLNSPEVLRDGPWDEYRLFTVASANLTLKTTTTENLAWVTDLESGKPLKDVPIVLYDKDFVVIGRGATDADGLAQITSPAPQEPYDGRFAVASDGKILAFTSTQWGSGVDMWNYGLWGSYYTPTNQPTAYIYTERPLYRPGQPVYFKGIVRLEDDLKYSLPETTKAHIRLGNYEETIYDEDVTLSKNGSFSGEIKLPAEATLGYYFLEVTLPGISENVIGSVNFNVAEYTRPEFQVSVSADPDNLLGGQKFVAQVQADYYSGGGVSGATVNWTLSASPFTFPSPEELSGYNFSDSDDEFIFYEAYYGDNPYNGGGEVVAQGEGVTDANGRFTISLPADLSDANASRSFVFEATVTDVSQSAVAGRTTIIGHRSQVYPGIRPAVYIGVAGEEQAFDVVAVDWDGKLLPGQKASVEIFERRWNSVQEQDASGRVTWKSEVEEIPITKFDDVLLDDKGKASVKFTPPNGGIFRARITALDAQGNPGRASAYMWVSDEKFVPWRQTNDHSFNLVTDRRSYSPGDTAEILIASPYQGSAYALVTVERGHIQQKEVIELTNNSTIYKLPIVAGMAPNVFVSVLIIKGVDKDNPSPDFKMAIVEIGVDTKQQALSIEIIPDRSQAGPGEMVQYTIRTSDYTGNPVSAEVSLSLSDLATLSLLPPNSPPILNFFYSKRSLSVWTSIPLAQIIDDYNAVMAESVAQGDFGGSGGAKGEGDLGVVQVRQRFPDTAYWDANVITGPNGEANVSVVLPDNLTTWRMEARAFTVDDLLVGQATQDIISSRPLLVRPQTPRFFVVGDQVTLGTGVNNNTDQALSVQVSLEAEGLTLKSEAIQTIDVPAHGQAYATWEAVVNDDAQRADLIFSASGGGHQDASRPPVGTLDNQGIPVYRYEARETVGTSGQMLEGGARLEAINLPESMKANAGDLNIKVSPSLAASMTDSLSYLEHYPYECTEQTVSRFLPNVLTTRAMKSAGLSDPKLEANLKEQVQIALQRLYAWQNADGGWSWWQDYQSDPLTSAYVVLGLLEAQEAKYSVNQDVIDSGVRYLNTRLLTLSQFNTPSDLNRQAFLLYVLARSGHPQVSATVKLYDQWQGMAIYARAFLAQTLYQIDAADPRIKTLLSDFASTAILSATGTHWEEKENDYWNWNTDTRTTAIVLSTLSQLDPNNQVNANAVRWLMSHRVNGHWWGTQETAWTLMGLTNWMVASGELQANYQYAVALNGKRMGGGIANQETLRQTYILRVDIADLLTSEANRLVFARDGGPGNLYYTAHLNVMLPVEQIKALNQGIIISRSYYRLDDFDTPVVQAQQGEMLLARVTLVAPASLHYVIIDDPLPAGLQAVDQSFSTSPQSVDVPQQYSWNDIFWRGWGWWWFSHVQRHDEKVVLSANYLPTGTYIYTYLVRASTIGIFKTIPTTAQEFYFPEVYGRGEGSLFTVTP